jgi:hypothetical protein
LGFICEVYVFHRGAYFKPLLGSLMKLLNSSRVKLDRSERAIVQELVQGSFQGTIVEDDSTLVSEISEDTEELLGRRENMMNSGVYTRWVVRTTASSHASDTIHSEPPPLINNCIRIHSNLHSRRRIIGSLLARTDQSRCPRLIQHCQEIRQV